MRNLMPANWSSLPGPDDIAQVLLPNGITVLSRPNFSSESVVLSGYLPAGSVFDPPELLGLAYFTGITLMRGTQQRTFQQIFDLLEGAGASLSIGASVHTVSFGARALAEDLPLLLELLSDSLKYPVFPPEYIERLRKQILISHTIREQDTGEMSSLRFDEILFANHPYGRPEDGYLDTIPRITRQHLVDFHARHYSPRGMVIAVVGAVSPEQAADQVAAALGDWQTPPPPEFPAFPLACPPAEPIRQHITIPGKVQTDLVMGCLGPPRRSPDYFAASLGNSILGQFGMMGRIGDAVREKSGLAYHASTSLNAWHAAGSWEVSAGVNPANVDRAIDLINDELRRFTSEPVTQAELEDSQSSFIWSLPLSFESNAGVVQALLKMHRFELGMDYYRRYPGLVEAVTPEDVLETARRYLNPEQMVVVSAGPPLAVPKPL